MKLRQKNRLSYLRFWYVESADFWLRVLIVVSVLYIIFGILEISGVTRLAGRATGAIVGVMGMVALLSIPLISLFTTKNKLPKNSKKSIKVNSLKSTNPEKLKRPPFIFLLNLSKYLPAKHAGSLEQEISDLRIEYYGALAENNFWRARCIVAFYYTGLSWSVLRWVAERAKELVGFMPKVN